MMKRINWQTCSQNDVATKENRVDNVNREKETPLVSLYALKDDKEMPGKLYANRLNSLDKIEKQLRNWKNSNYLWHENYQMMNWI